MTEETQNSGDYDVGYGKPPKHTQFKKGQSGNPTGKAKKETSLRAKLKKLAGEEVVVHQNGVPVTMTKDEAMLVSVLMKAMKGDLAAAKFVAATLGAEPEASAAAPEIEVSSADLAALQHQADWLGVLEQARAECLAAEQDDPNNEGEDHDKAP
jgi:hypothetical protein